MPGATRPFIALYVVWHPSFAGGRAIGKAVFDHYRREVFISVAGATGVSVQFRSAAAAGGSVPLGIDPDEAETTAIVVLVDSNVLADGEWIAYAQSLAAMANGSGLRVRVFPVAVDGRALRVANPLARINFIRWDKWENATGAFRRRKLLSELTYQCCRMLRVYLEHLRRPGSGAKALEKYLEPVRLFLSHSKHDRDGERVAVTIRDHIYGAQDLESFFDAKNIPSGVNFDEVLEHYVRVSAVIAVQTNSYSSREWCRREIIEAKQSSVPLIVAHCVTDSEERGFPYLGNVPVVRMGRAAGPRLDLLISRLLDEVFKDFLWRCRVEVGRALGGKAMFLPRAPELISLLAREIVSGRRRGARIVVYPDPPLGAEEEALLTAVAPKLRFMSHTGWVASP